jgi:urease beta subunit
LEFDRKEAFGFRLDIPSGTSVRFEPGEKRLVRLVALGGKKVVYGCNDLTVGEAIPENLDRALERARAKQMRGI